MNAARWKFVEDRSCVGAMRTFSEIILERVRTYIHGHYSQTKKYKMQHCVMSAW